MPFVGDDVTVVDGIELRRGRVSGVRAPETLRVWKASGRDHTGFDDYQLADEGITWVRGFHEKGAPELASLLAYITMR